MTDLEEFKRDESECIQQLREFVGGEAAKELDGSPQSLRLLDAFVANLTARGDWASSDLFREVSPNMEKWLPVRIGYYFATVVRGEGASEWHLSVAPESRLVGTPVMELNGVEFSPLEIAHALVKGEVRGGLSQLLQDLGTTPLP